MAERANYSMMEWRYEGWRSVLRFGAPLEINRESRQCATDVGNCDIEREMDGVLGGGGRI